MSVVQVAKRGSGCHILLNRPKALNSLNYEMAIKVREAYAEHTPREGGFFVMRGEGKAFCAGGDIVAMHAAGRNDPSEEVDETKMNRQFFRTEYHMNHEIGTSSMPQIALIKGVTMGGGVGLSVHGKYRVCTDSTLFAMPETAIGFFPDVGGSFFLPRLPSGPATGMYLALTGDRLKGSDVCAAGVATHYVPEEKWAAFESAVLSVEHCTQIDAVLDEFSQQPKQNDWSLSKFRPKIEQIFGLSSVDEILVALEKESDPFFKKARDTLDRVSPLSVHVTFEQLSRGANLDSLSECLEMEFRISDQFMKRGDFFEGVRALLIDKDKKPVWEPSTYASVSRQDVEAFFAPIPHPLFSDTYLP